MTDNQISSFQASEEENADHQTLHFHPHGPDHLRHHPVSVTKIPNIRWPMPGPMYLCTILAIPNPVLRRLQAGQAEEARQKRPTADLHVDDQARFESFSLQSCHLTWAVSTQRRENVVFILAGQDQGGMWHLVVGNMTTNRLDMAPSFGAKYPTVAVIAVNSQQVLDILRLNLPTFQECGNEEKIFHSNNVLRNDLIIIIILAVFVLILFIILLLIVCWNTSSPHITNRRTERNPEMKIMFTKEKEELASRSLKISSENTYVDLPHFDEDIV